MKVKHLKTKTTIELTPLELHDWITNVNNINMMIDNIKEMNDMYLSDVGNLERIQYRLVDLLDLEWSRERYRYIKGGQEWHMIY